MPYLATLLADRPQMLQIGQQEVMLCRGCRCSRCDRFGGLHPETENLEDPYFLCLNYNCLEKAIGVFKTALFDAAVRLAGYGGLNR